MLNDSEKSSSSSSAADTKEVQYATMAEELASGPKESLQTWLQALGAFLVYAATLGILSAYGTCASYYETTVVPGSSSNAISWVGTIDAILLIMGGVLSGPIYDRGYVRELLLFGSLLTVVGIMMTSLATKYWHILLAQGLCVEIGGGILSNPAITLINASFSGNRTFALGLATSGTSIAGIIYLIILSRLILRVGFAWATRILGFITLGELLVALAIMLPYVKQSKEKIDHQSPFADFWDENAFRDPAGLMGLSAAFFFISFFIPTFAEYKLGANAKVSTDILVIFNASGLIGCVLAVLTSNKFGVPKTIPCFALATAAILLGWFGVKNIASFYVWIVLISIIMNTLAVVCPAMLVHVSQSKDVMGGRRQGIAFAFTSAGVLVGTPVASALIDLETGSFWKMHVFIGICMAAGGGCLIFVQRQVAKNATRTNI